MTSFQSFHLNPMIERALQALGFEIPTPIQASAVPPLMSGRDVLAAAATGSGKTAAFGLPILHKLAAMPRGVSRVLVLAPTRELAAQIAEHLKALSGRTGVRVAAIFGGVAMRPQEQALRSGTDILVATPGRLLDHLGRGTARLDRIETLVLDEADRMLDMGFLPDVRRVIQQVPAARQTMLFSATMPAPIVELSREMLRDPVPINIERRSAPAAGVRHAIYPVPERLKSALLVALLKALPAPSVLAFTRTKHRANRLADYLSRHGVNAARIHGNRSQNQRTEALQGFKEGRFRVLVATDIAARGIDIEELALVVNFDVPHIAEDYIHRVGRTARADAVGDAVTLVSPDEEQDLRHIERHIGKALPRQRLDGFDYNQREAERLEIPIRERIAQIRARKSEERQRSRAKAESRDQRDRVSGARQKDPKPALPPRAALILRSEDQTRPVVQRSFHPRRGRRPANTAQR